ncbi:MAG: cyclic nucleotide-binding domain-containing protein [Pseudomonadota bacterium]|nr:cyclic nucleotide-binding domain-containing protein [Pseudomonadota bacterium]
MSIEQMSAQAMAWMSRELSSPSEIVALCSAAIAGGLTLTSSFVKTMVPLRFLAVGSNLGFLLFGILHPSPVMAMLQGSLLPINLYRSLEMVRLTRRVRAASRDADMSGVWLKPYMKSKRRPAGSILFSRGDIAEHLYFLAEGRVEFVEIGQSIGPGQIFGEIAFFAPDRRRTLTARCSEDSLVLRVDQGTVRQLYFQNPSFGFELVGLVAARLSADVNRLEAQLARKDTAAQSAPTPSVP